MDAPALINFPLPMLTALLCAFIAALIWRLDLGPMRANIAFFALFFLCAIEALLVALRFGYGVTEFIPLQRTLPLFLGPIIYLGFMATVVTKNRFAKIFATHLSAPFLLLGLIWTLADDLRLIDWAISASYLYYIVVLFALWRRGPDALSFAPIDVAGSLSNWTLRAIGLLIFVLTLDTAIALDFAFNNAAGVARLISFGTIPLVLALLAFLLTLPPLLARPKAAALKLAPPLLSDQQVEARVREVMAEAKLFLDPELTVQRLAKRLHEPARNVSGAINKVRGMNVSQYVNEYRLTHAADLLVTSDASVTSIAEQSGFLARSNFYREFQRVYGVSPIEYRQNARSNAETNNLN